MCSNICFHVAAVNEMVVPNIIKTNMNITCTKIKKNILKILIDQPISVHFYLLQDAFLLEGTRMLLDKLPRGLVDGLVWEVIDRPNLDKNIAYMRLNSSIMVALFIYKFRVIKIPKHPK